MLSQVIGGMLLPTISFCLLLVMNSPKLVRLRQGNEGRQSVGYNGMLIFSCVATCFLACTAVLPILTFGKLSGMLLYAVSGVAAAVMLMFSARVVQGAEAAAAAEIQRLRGGDPGIAIASSEDADGTITQLS